MPAAPRAGVTLADVAAAAQVSTATVSRVLSGNYPVAARTRARVTQAVADLGYVMNVNARALARSRTSTIGIVVQDVAEPFFGHIARGVERRAAELGLACLIMASRGSKERELELVDLLRSYRAGGVILVGGATDDRGYRTKLAHRARALADEGGILVLCGRPPLGDGAPTRSVGYDNEGGAFAVTSHLLAQGHRRIAYVGGPPRLSTHTHRLAGYRRALEQHGVAWDDDLVHVGRFDAAFGRATVAGLLRHGLAATAVFAANDEVAVGVYEAAEEAGVAIPGDLSVVGYDDVPVATHLRPRLTTVSVPLEELGRRAAELCVADGADAVDAVVGTRLVVRDSVAAPRAATEPGALSSAES
ncbi:LacI family DNA-binding transcriptional regulator [Xylanimonas ulmi]|uniref:LacI family transcriptional regulator n=1 Tax=Xylanimonas ulmi TaxID=228973 RepID=A0A4Q7LZX9_9MICO|nr:LacI family DNA-binding transcriptional regulator [Xylanibacterium ulmi]RZS61016.1 LacI family transcriptional regulator [Xylanibacterium ulmi]